MVKPILTVLTLCLVSSEPSFRLDGGDPLGSFVPLYLKDAASRQLKSFLIDTSPVTNTEFLTFVQENPKWRPEFMEAADGTTGVYRVSATMADYYNFRYDSERDYLCVRACDAHGRATFWAYAARLSETAAQLLRLFEQAEDGSAARAPINVTLRLKFVRHWDGLAHSQALILIEEVVSDSWFLGNG